MTTLPTTVEIAKLPLYLPNGLPVWAHDVELDLVIQPERMYVGIAASFDSVNAKLIARSGVYGGVELPEPNPFAPSELALELVAKPEVCEQFHKLFLAVEDPVALFVSGPMPEGASYSPLLALDSYELRDSYIVEDDGDDIEDDDF